MTIWTMYYVLQNSRFCCVYSQTFLNTHTRVTSSEFAAVYIKRFLESFGSSSILQNVRLCQGSDVHTPTSADQGRDAELVLSCLGTLIQFFGELGHEAILGKQSILASLPISASSTNRTLMSNTEIFSYENKDTPSNRSITAEKKLSNGNLGSQKNVLYVQRCMF